VVRGPPQISFCKYDYQNKQFFRIHCCERARDGEREMKVASVNNETKDSMEPEHKATIMDAESAAGAMRSTHLSHCSETIVVRAAAIRRRGAGYTVEALTT